MNSRKFFKRIHPIAGTLAWVVILVFLISTIASKISHNFELILLVKTMILYGMTILIPSMVVVGMSGFKLGGKSKAPIILAKKKRMPIIALNGIFILMPCAIFLYSLSKAGTYNQVYNVVQIIELCAGFVNFTLLTLNLPKDLKNSI